MQNHRKNTSEKRVLRRFDSFEEMEDDQLAYFSSLTPVQLLAMHRQLCLAAFGFRDESEFEKPDRKIRFV